MRIMMIALVAVLCWLQYTFWLGKNGITDYLATKKQVAIYEKAIAKLEQRNQHVYAEINNLRQGLESVEERARNELGLIKSSETFFRIVDEKDEH